MADARYVIDLILKARDETSAAAQSALRNMTSLEGAQKRLGDQATKLSEQYERAFRKIDDSSRSLKDSRTELAALADEWGAYSRKTLDAQLKLDRAAREHERTLQRYGESSREAAASLGDLNDAHQKVIRTVEADNAARKDGIKWVGDEIAQEIRLTAVLDEQAQVREKHARDVGRAEQEEAQRTNQQEAQLARDRDRRQRDYEAMLRATEQARQRAARYGAAGASGDIQQRVDLDVRDFETKLRLIAQQIRELDGKEINVDIDLRTARFEDDMRRAEQQLRAQQREQEAALRQQQREAEAAARQRAQVYSRFAQEAARIDRDRDVRERNYQNSLRETQRLRERAQQYRTAGASEDIQANVDVDAAAAEAKLVAVAEQLRELDGKDVNVDLDLRTAGFDTNMRRVNQETQSFWESLDASSSRMAAFDNMIRGAFTFAVTIFLQQLLQIGTATVGMLTALASSAIEAGAALGGALAAGATQAIPVLGVLGTVASRMGTVMNAFKQANLLQQQESYKGTQAANQQANATDAVTNAHEALAGAQRRVADAQRNLTQARIEARRQLDDLILAERAAELAAQGATLSQEDAQKALQQAVISGQGGDIARRQLAVRESNLGVDQSQQRLVEARRNLTEGSNPEQTDRVRQAKRSLDDARRAAEQAERGLAKANRTADATGANVSAAAGKLAFLRAQLSGAERDLLDALLKLQTTFQAFGRDISAPIIEQMTRAVRWATEMLQDPRIVRAARSLSSGIADQMGRIFDSFTDSDTIDQILGFARDARRNLKPIADILIALGHAFLNIGQDAAPALHDLLTWIRDIAQAFGDWIKHAHDTGQLTDFFQRGLGHIKSWATLLYEVVRLFLAITGQGGAATQGKSAIDDMAGAIGRAADQINTAGSRAQRFWGDFFETSRRVINELRPIWTAIKEEFSKTFGSDTVGSVRGFASIMSEFVIPTAGRFLRAVGHITEFVGDLVRKFPTFTDWLSKIVALTLTILTVRKGLTIFEPLERIMKSRTALGLVAGMLERIALALGKIPGVGGGLASVVNALTGRVRGGIPGAATTAAKPGLGTIESMYGGAAKTGATAAETAAKGGGLLSRIAGSPLTKGLGKLGLQGLALDFGINLIDQKGNPIKAVQNTASGLTFGLIPRVPDEEKIQKVRIEEETDINLQRGAGGARLSGADRARLEGINKDYERQQEIIRKNREDLLYSRGTNRPGLVAEQEANIAKAQTRAAQDAKKAGQLYAQNFVAGANDTRFWTGSKLFQQVQRQLSSLPKDARQTALDGMVSFARELERQGRLPRGSAATLVKQISKEFGLLPTGIKQAGKDGVDDLKRQFQRKDALEAARKQVEALQKTWADAPRGLTFKTGTATQDFAKEIDFLEDKLKNKHLTKSMRKQVEEDLKAVKQAAAHWGRLAVADLDDQLKDMGLKGDKRSATARDKIIEKFAQAAAGVKGAAGDAKKALDDELKDMGLKGDKKSRAARDAIVKAFGQMATGVGTSGQNASDALYEALQNMGGNADSVLKALGFSPPKWQIRKAFNHAMNASPGSDAAQRTAQTGRFIPGAGEGDHVPVLTEPGEYVLNKKAVAGVGRGLLDFLNYRKFPRFQGGGAIWNGHPALRGAIARAVGAVEDKFPGLVVTSTTDHSRMTTSGNVSNHTMGIAADISGAADEMRQAASWIKRSFGSSLLEGIHNPNLSIKNGEVVPAGFWGGAWGEHINHIHIALRKLTGGIEDVATKIPRVLVQGADGALKDAAQGIADRVRKAANRYIGRQSNALDDNDFSDVGGGGNNQQNQSLAKRMAARMGWTGGQWTALRNIWSRESGFDATIHYGGGHGYVPGLAYGIPQALPGDKMASAGKDWRTNPKTQIEWGLNYIKQRYGDPASAWAFWQANSAYATGGEIPGPQGAAIPIFAHAGEWVVNPSQQTKLAQWMGTTADRLRSMLGFTGGPTSFQGGGAPVAVGQVPQQTQIQYHIVLGRYAKALLDTTKENERHARIMATLIGKNHADERKTENARHDEVVKGLDKVKKASRDAFDNANTGLTVGRQQRQLVGAGRYRADAAISPTSIPGIEGQVSLAQQATRNLGRISGIGPKLGRFIKNVGALADEGGLIDQLGAAIDRQVSRMATNVALAEVGLRRVGRNLVARRRLTDPVRIATRELGNLERTGTNLMQERATTANTLGGVDRRIAQIRQGGVTGKERDQFVKLLAQRQELVTALDDQDSKIAQNRADIYAKRVDRFTAQTAKALRPAQEDQRQADLSGRINAIFGRGDAVAQAGVDSLKALQSQQKTLHERLAAATAKAHKDPRWQAVVDDLQQQTDAIDESVASKTHENLQTGLESVNSFFDRQQGGLDIQRRIATALGNTDALPDIAQQSINLLQQQSDALQTQLAAAQAAGDVGLANQIADQIAGIHASIVEGTAEMLQTAIAQTETNFQRENARLDLLGRGADLQERTGNRLGAIRTRQGVGEQRLAAMNAEMTSYQSLYAQAAAQGNVGAMRDLGDKIATLSQDIKDQTQANRELTFTYRQTATDIITGKSDRAAGLIGSGTSLWEKISQITGTPNPEVAKANAVATGEVLKGAARDIAGDVADAVSGSEFTDPGANTVLGALSSAFQDSPGSFASKLAELGPTIAELESTMGDTERTAFAALIQAMLDNTDKTLDNTISLKTLDGSLNQPQGFASSAWQWYREAIFTGMGDVLPQYDIPHMQSGGHISRGGLFRLHPGEFVINPQGSNVPDSGDINITMNAVDGEVDLTALASRIAFEKKSRFN